MISQETECNIRKSEVEALRTYLGHVRYFFSSFLAVPGAGQGAILLSIIIGFGFFSGVRMSTAFRTYSTGLKRPLLFTNLSANSRHSIIGRQIVISYKILYLEHFHTFQLPRERYLIQNNLSSPFRSVCTRVMHRGACQKYTRQSNRRRSQASFLELPIRHANLLSPLGHHKMKRYDWTMHVRSASLSQEISRNKGNRSGRSV